MRPKVALLLGAATLVACAIGVRGDVAFEAEHDLTGIEDVILDLPSTPVRVEACDASVAATCPASLDYEGRLEFDRGHPAGCDRQRRRCRAGVERDGLLGRLRGDVPQELTGLVDLELGVATLPSDRNLDIRTDLGDVEVLDVQGAVTIDTDIGSVFVRGAAGGVGVRSGLGPIELEVGGHADARTGEGTIDVVQTGSLADLFARTEIGNIRVELGR